jgi:hypothetical protein
VLSASDDECLGGFLPAGVVRGATMGDPEGVLVGVDLVKVEPGGDLDVLVDVEREASRLVAQ